MSSSTYDRCSHEELVSLCVAKDIELMDLKEALVNAVGKVTRESGGEDSGSEIEDESRL